MQGDNLFELLRKADGSKPVYYRHKGIDILINGYKEEDEAIILTTI